MPRQTSRLWIPSNTLHGCHDCRCVAGFQWINRRISYETGRRSLPRHHRPQSPYRFSPARRVCAASLHGTNVARNKMRCDREPASDLKQAVEAFRATIAHNRLIAFRQLAEFVLRLSTEPMLPETKCVAAESLLPI